MGIKVQHKVQQYLAITFAAITTIFAAKRNGSPIKGAGSIDMVCPLLAHARVHLLGFPRRFRYHLGGQAIEAKKSLFDLPFPQKTSGPHHDY